ncbi:U4/U6 small nuclear ribonucleoprotein PRP4, partial [Phenoliferia sp. Uapishka_3]
MDIDFDSLEDRAQDFEGADAHPETARILQELDAKKTARRIAVPTKDLDVRARLREEGEPITLFGERPEDRRDRLRSIWNLKRSAKADMAMDEDSDDSSDSGEEGEKEEEFYTEGTMDLKQARKNMAEFSMERARKRLARQRLETSLPLGRLMDVRRAVYAELKTFTNLGSQIGDTRPLSSLRFSPDSSMLFTSSWTGHAKLWSIPACKEIKTLKAHKERIGGVAWHPQATLSQSRTAVNFATSGADNDVKLWGLETDQPLLTLAGHSARVCRIAFHPSGKYIGSASYDGTWRLWDAERGGEELLLQEGHSKEVYAIAFQEDGALVCTGGLDAIGRVWDLRSGKTAMVLDGHVKDILGIDFSPNGHQIATGSNDDTVRIWDMRSLKSIKTIPAHKSAVSDVKFFRTAPGLDSFPSTAVPFGLSKLPAFADDVRDPIEKDGEKADVPLSGSFLVTGGYDGMVKVWSADDWQLVKSMTSDAAGKVMSIDVSSDARFLASAEYSRTFKLWSNPNVDLS